MLWKDLGDILIDSVFVSRSADGSVILKEKNVMKVEITGMPQHAIAIKLGKIGSFSGIKDGVWKRNCDYLLVCALDGRDLAIFVELKKTMNGGGKGMEQLRRSLPLLEYLCGICRMQHDTSRNGSTPIVSYFLISIKRSPRFDKQHVRSKPSVEKERHKNIDVRTFLGTRIGFGLLSGL